MKQTARSALGPRLVTGEQEKRNKSVTVERHEVNTYWA